MWTMSNLCIRGERKVLIFRVLRVFFSSKILWGRGPFVHLHEKFINAFYIKTEIQQIKPSPPPYPFNLITPCSHTTLPFNHPPIHYVVCVGEVPDGVKRCRGRVVEREEEGATLLELTREVTLELSFLTGLCADYPKHST